MAAKHAQYVLTEPSHAEQESTETLQVGIGTSGGRETSWQLLDQ